MARPPASIPRWLAPATAALAGATASVAALGPLGAGLVDHRVPPLLHDRLVGSAAVSLAVLVPLTLAAALLLRRRSPAGPLLALSVALGHWYLAAELVLVPERTGRPGDDEVFLPLFVAVLLLATAVAVGAWSAASTATTRLDRPTGTLVGVGLLMGSGLFVLGRHVPAWLDVVRGAPSAEYLAGPGAWWAVAFQELALLLPVSAAAGIAVLRRLPWSGHAAFAASGLLAVVGAAVGGAAWSSTRGYAGPTVDGATSTSAIGLVTAVPAVLCWVAVARTGRQNWASPVDHPGAGPAPDVGPRASSPAVAAPEARSDRHPGTIPRPRSAP
ncbi:hypothetical protein GCM10023328_11670 [Modestobacter marinus]|uniref:Uncharacterized protein n=1 Tax=Modestobacter marinus TaxID=477641 RepID=A0A846LUQ7_9ACTN|nr:hypothetical protein [Modestobacter marinus]NIH69198.1 hypothetical protein [Modestobacter marinus]GGL76722.1 hypothetical protein GCM10011589_36020 [Modestobacter marinus]